MSALANRISELAGRLGTIEGLEHVNQELLSLNERLVKDSFELSRDETIAIHDALGFLGNAISEMNRVARGMLENAGIGGIDNVG